MSTEDFIPIKTLCSHYKIETTFFSSLNDYGLIELTTVEKVYCVHQDHLKNIETMIHLHKDLHINFEGIDTVLNLLNKIEQLQSELQGTRNRLGLYEEGL